MLVEIFMPASDDRPLVWEMAAELKRWGFDKTDNLKGNKIEEAWVSHSLHRDLMQACESIQFPVYPSSVLLKRDHWESLKKIDLQRGGTFINEIETRHVPAVLELLASFVRCDSSGKKHHGWQKKISQKSRV